MAYSLNLSILVLSHWRCAVPTLLARVLALWRTLRTSITTLLLSVLTWRRALTIVWLLLLSILATRGLTVASLLLSGLRLLL